METVNIKIKIDKNGVEPKYMTEGAAGMDVFADINEPVLIKPFERVLIPTGLYMEIPYGYEIQVRPRSGLTIKHGITLLNSPGTIDSDYRGEIKIIMINISNTEYEIAAGERICQFVVQKVIRANFIKSDILTETKRESGGFGHTGKN